MPRRQAFLPPIKADTKLEARKRSQLDRLYQRVIDDLDALVRAVGLKAALISRQTGTKFLLRAQ